MLKDVHCLLEQYLENVPDASSFEQIGLEHEPQSAPHDPHRLPAGKCAVYVFSMSDKAGKICGAGPHRALKVGRVGPRWPAGGKNEAFPTAQGTRRRGPVYRLRGMHGHLP